MRQYMTEFALPYSYGYRLNEQALSVKVAEHDIGQVTEFSIENAVAFFEGISFRNKRNRLRRLSLKRILSRLTFLKNVGLDYLTLSRTAGTLSGGEARRIRLATQMEANINASVYSIFWILTIISGLPVRWHTISCDQMMKNSRPQ